MPFKPPICMRFETVFAPTLTTLLMTRSPVGQPSVAASNSEPIVATDHAVRCVLCVRCWDPTEFLSTAYVGDWGM